MRKFTIARRITLTLVVILVLVGMFFNTGSGTLSSFGWEAIAYICPLGILETWLASWTFLPRTVVALIVCVIAVILLGKVFCAWLCPVPPLRKFFTFEKKNDELPAGESKALEAAADDAGAAEVAEAAEAAEAEAVAVTAETLDPAYEVTIPKCDPDAASSSCASSGCSSCAEKRKKFDSRHLILGGALLSTVIFGFPVFCIVCPVGLTFASLIALWRLVGFNEPSWALLIFPLILFLELFVLRKWCLKFCPLGALMSLMSIPNKLFRPKVDESKCLRMQGSECSLCVRVCEEELDPHFSDGMHECTKCGLCVEVCPAQAVKIPLYAPTPKKEQEKLSIE